MRPSYHKELDGVRAIAALMVMFFHFVQGAVVSGWLFQASLFGQTGVSLFFVLSGFLITRILLSTRDEPDYFSRFYIRRTLRIFPLYYFYLCIAYYLVPLMVGTDVPSFALQVYEWFYLQDFAQTFRWKFEGPKHFWSLAVEEHFYLFWPLLVYYLNKKALRNAIWLIIATAFVLRIWLVREHFKIYYLGFTRMDELALGALLATMEMKMKANRRSSTRFLILFAAIITPTLAISGLYSGSANTIVQVFKYNLISLSYFALIGFIITAPQEHRLKALLKKAPFAYTGRISYGLYVYHPLCFLLYSRHFRTNILLIDLVGSFAMAYLTAALSYRFLEEPFLRLKKYFEYGKNALRGGDSTQPMMS